MTTTFGMRVDLVRRFDALRNLQRQSSTELGPRLGSPRADLRREERSARDLRKYHQQLMGTRNPVPSFGGNDAQGLRNTYDLTRTASSRP